MRNTDFIISSEDDIMIVLPKIILRFLFEWNIQGLLIGRGVKALK
jgi:hypothetical protein